MPSAVVVMNRRLIQSSGTKSKLLISRESEKGEARGGGEVEKRIAGEM